MDESEDNISAEDIKTEFGQSGKTKPKKRSLVERELETSLTSRVTSPISNPKSSNTSRYGRARKVKTKPDSVGFEKTLVIKIERSTTSEKTPVKVQSPVYKMHASNSPMRSESPKGTPNKVVKTEPDLENQIENIYHENISLSRFGSEEKKHTPTKIPKVYVRKDLIQTRDEEESMTLIKNLFSPSKSGNKSNSHIKNVLERSSEKYGLNASPKSQNGYASVVKTLDFDSKKKKKENGNAKMLSKSEIFDMEAKCEYQVGDLAWSRMGTYPFWPCIVTREPSSGMFVKKKLFGRIERDVIHVTFFGDNGRRGWIVETMLRKFHGQLEFEAAREQFTPADKKKDPRLYAAFFISEKKQPQWNISVEEAELLLREPKRLRIDILNDMLLNARASKTTPRQNKSVKITRTASDVSLSESLYDTLFSEDDGKEESDRSRNRSRNKSLDVSEVVTACLDNMAAKTGITKIQRQSHMDRWLQKAKSNTPEKSQARPQLVPQKVENKETKVSSAKKKKRSPKPNPRPLTQKPYSFRRSANESQPPQLENDINNLEFAPSLNSTLNNIEEDSDGIINIEQLQSGIGFIAKVESLSDSANESVKYDDVEEHLNHESTEDKEYNKSRSRSIQRNDTNESTNDANTSVTDQGIVSIEAKSATESESYSVSTSLESDKVPVDTKIKYLDSNGMDISSIEESKEISEIAGEDKLVHCIDKPKSFIEESREVNTIVTECDNSLDNHEIKISSIDENKESNRFAPQESSMASIKNSVLEDVNPTLPNNLVNGEISDHDMSEMSSKDSDSKSNSTQNSSSGGQDRSMNDFMKPLNTEVTKKPYTDPKFLKYLELRQDSIMDQHPDLSHDEIVEYLHKTWMYEEKSTGDTKETDNRKQSNKGLNKTNAKSKNTQTRKTRQRKINKYNGTMENEKHRNQDQIDECMKSPETNTISNEIHVDNDVCEKFSTQKYKASNDLSETNEQKNHDEIILNSNENIQNKLLDEVENMYGNKSPEANRCIEENSIVPILESKETCQEDMDESVPEKELVEEGNTSETCGPTTEIPVGDSQNTSNKTAIIIPVCEETSESTKVPEDDSSKIPCEIDKHSLEDVTNTENILYEQVVKESVPKANVSVTDSQFISHCSLAKVAVSEERELNKSPKENRCNEENLIHPTYEDMDVSYPEKKLVEEGHTSKTYGPTTKIAVGDSQNTSNKTAIIIPVCEETSESQNTSNKTAIIMPVCEETSESTKVPEDDSSNIPSEKDKNLVEDVTNTENKLNEQVVKESPEKDLLKKDNSSETEIYDSNKLIKVADSQNTSRDTAKNVKLREQTSESHKEPEKDVVPCEKEKNTYEDITVSFTENKSYEKETKGNVPVTDRQFFSNCKPISVGVSEKTEVEIFANKIRDRDDDDDMLISAVDLDDEFSDESLDISYAISPLSVKGDETNVDDLKNEASELHENQNHEVHEKPIFNGVCDSDVENVDMDKYTTNTLINEAGPKENVVSNETEHVVEDKEEEINDDQNKQIADSTELNVVAKMNGTHVSKFREDLEGDNSSVHSEDSEPLSVTKSKLKLKRQERVNKYADPEFVLYLEMRQDDVMDSHPELNQDEIVEYLYKTWLYEENSKSEIRKTDDVQQSTLIKGLGEPKPETKKRKPREAKEKKKEKDTIIGKDSDVETASVKSEESTTLRRWLRPKRYTSRLYADFDSSRDSSPAITDDITSETISLNSLDSDDSRANKNSPRSKTLKPFKVKSDKLSVSDDIKVEKETMDLPNNIDLTKTNESPPKMVNGFQETDVNVKEELDPETASLNSEASEVSLSKRKPRSKGEKTMNHPEFVKYLELRQDALIDENPQLTQDEIVGYLYKTWLYEESVKSDVKKSDEIEQSNLVKGINPENVFAKKVIRKKFKLEKYVDEETMKVKPKRKTIQPYYNEDYSDIEDEIAIFEIMKTSPKVELSKMDLTGLISNDTETKAIVPAEKAKESIETKQKEEEVIDIADEIDEVEFFFKELTQPKPNLFKGLVREKVCEICEKVGNLVKCKGCNGMFHLDCVKQALEVIEKVSAPSKVRKKKKKKGGRKAKSLDDSGSMSDEKSQDVSAENMSVDEIIEPVSRTVDAVNFEAQLELKMKELLENNDKEIHYDSYSSDDGLDWEGTIAGKCEIVDVKLKPKNQCIDSNFKCNNCQKYEVPICFVCKSAVSKTGVEYRQRCQVAHCHKYYHLECLDHWPQTQFSSGDSWNKKTNEKAESHMCPRHVCHTCVSDDPRGCKTRFSGDKLARCVRCPATYHSFTKCLPAGTQILTGSHIICPRHHELRPGKVPCHVNTGWCFICALGGTLICCEYCPTSFHAECLNISPPEGNYMCEDCETGRLPLYGEMVWVKLGHYRWWPGLILHPSEIPDNIMAVKHSTGEFVVRFFGQYDHYWVNRGRVFPFQEGDSGKISSQKSKIDAAFTMAMEHAQRACQILKNAQENEEESLDIASSLLPPHYVKLKVNKPVGSLINKRVDIEESSLNQCDCDPLVPDPCGPYSQCLNRMLLTECGPICRAGDRCNNRAFEKRQYPKMVPYRTSHRGWGLKTLEDIKAGQFVIEYVGELIDEEEFKRRMARMHEIRDENFYFLTLDKERMIDAGPKGNLARFMNHCCEPNCETQKWTVLGDVRVGLFAIHDIPANSEVTFNYNLECAGIDKKRCMCGAKRCAGYIGAKPKQDESQSKKSKVAAKRTYKKRKNTEESPSTKSKPKRPVGRPAKSKELTEIEKDLIIIKNATNGISSDSECSRLSSLEGERHKALKRKRVSFSTEEVVLNGSPSVKKIKLDDKVD